MNKFFKFLFLVAFVFFIINCSSDYDIKNCHEIELNDGGFGATLPCEDLKEILFELDGTICNCE